jgi:hypothetical protein
MQSTATVIMTAGLCWQKEKTRAQKDKSPTLHGLQLRACRLIEN